MHARRVFKNFRHHKKGVKSPKKSVSVVTKSKNDSTNNNCPPGTAPNTLSFEVLDNDAEVSAATTLQSVLEDHGLDYAQVKEIMDTNQLSDSQVLETLSKVGTSTTLAIQGENASL